MTTVNYSSIKDDLPRLEAQALRYTRGDRNLTDELVQHVQVQWFRGKYDPARGTFTAWARVVMWHYLADLRRRRFRAVGGDDTFPDSADPRDHAAATDQHLDLTTPFGHADLASILRWSARDRVLLLCRALLWRKVPTTLWSETLIDLGLPTDFPGPDFADLPESERNATLAGVFGIPVNTLAKRWERRREQVRRLRSVRELAEL